MSNRWTKNGHEASTPLAVAHRINGVLETPIIQSVVTSISRRVTNLATGAETLNDTISVSSSIYNTLQVWNEDGIGFNFRDVIPGSALPDSSEQYLVKYTFVMNPSSDGPIITQGTVSTL